MKSKSYKIKLEGMVYVWISFTGIRMYKVFYSPDFSYGDAYYYQGLDIAFAFNPMNEEYKELSSFCEETNLNVYDYVQRILIQKGFSVSREPTSKSGFGLPLGIIKDELVDVPYFPVAYWRDVKDQINT